MDDLDQIQNCLGNRLDRGALGARRIAGVIGAAPSQYSKSPGLWNAAFQALGMNAIYVAMDVETSRLKDLLNALRQSDRVLGINVTVPHKLDVMQYLDMIDDAALRIGAVNTIVRGADGRLSGFNTDGQGFIESIVAATPGDSVPFMGSLDNRRVLLLGAGGSARAVGYGLAHYLNDGELIICNRTLQHARELADGLAQVGAKVRAIDESELAPAAHSADLIVNSTIKGQGGLQRSADGSVVTMEPYSSLAPAHPRNVPEFAYGKANPQDTSRADIEANQRASLDLAKAISQSTRFYDLIYHPEETVFLRHGRLSGHRTMNGKSMIICQAVAAFCDHICKSELTSLGKNNPDLRTRVAEIMYAAW